MADQFCDGAASPFAPFHGNIPYPATLIRRLARIIMKFAVLVSIPALLSAQSTTGFLDGAIRNRDGVPQPGVAIILTSEPNFHVSLFSEAEGEFSLALPFGLYRVPYRQRPLTFSSPHSKPRESNGKEGKSRFCAPPGPRWNRGACSRLLRRFRASCSRSIRRDGSHRLHRFNRSSPGARNAARFFLDLYSIQAQRHGRDRFLSVRRPAPPARCGIA